MVIDTDDEIVKHRNPEQFTCFPQTLGHNPILEAGGRFA
jgi:hypothetical protein